MDRELKKMMEGVEVREAESRSREHLRRVFTGIVRCISNARRHLEAPAEGPSADREVLSTTHAALVELLRSEGVTLFGEAGDRVEAGRHEVMSVVDSPQETGTVVAVIEEGAVWSTGLLQKASVIASRATPDSDRTVENS